MQRALAFVALLLTLVSVSASAQVTAVPQLMNFQGRLAKPDGTPIVNGDYSVTFRLFNVATGGSALWSHTLPITVRNGTFAALLGGATGTKTGALTSTLFAGNRWLEIQVGADPPLTPRQQITSVAYAMKADSVKDGSITSASIANGAITSTDLAAGVLDFWKLAGNSGTNPASQFLGTTDAQPLVFKTNNAERLRILSDGKVGIGLNNPAFRLDIRAAGIADGLRLSGTGGNAPGLFLHNNTTERGTLGLALSNGQYSDSAVANDIVLRALGGKLHLQTGDTTATMTFAGSNVGIGTVTPTAKLHVVGNTNLSGTLTTGGNLTAPSATIPTLNGNVNVSGRLETNLTDFLAFVGRSSSNLGTWFLLENTSTGGRRWSLISSGSGNGEGAGKLLIGDETAGVTRLTIDTTGNVGIGTSSPDSRLHLDGAFHKSSTGDFAVDASNIVGGRFVVKQSGNVGIGVNNPAAKLHIDGAYRQSSTGDFKVDAPNAPGGRFTIKVNGDVGIGTDNPGFKLHVNGSVAGVGNYQNVSDARYKTNIAAFPNALDAILNLRGVTFDWKQEDFPDMNFADGKQIGFIAQEVEQILPELVMTDAKGYKSVAYANIVPVLVEALKQQQKQITAQQAKMEALEKQVGRIAELEARLNALDTKR
jgi:hypothetical protein